MAETFSPEYLSGLKQKFNDIQTEARKEVRRKKRERVTEVKEELYQKLEVLSEKISALYSAVYLDPDKLSLEMARDFVLNDSKPYLTEEEAKDLKAAIEGYYKKRQAVKEFIKSTRSQEQAFLACFGFIPKGKMEIIPGPMTLTFRLYEKEDFRNAYLTDFAGLSTKEMGKVEQESESVAGAALWFSKIPDLAGALILENASKNSLEKKIFTKSVTVISGVEKNRINEYFYPKGFESNVIFFDIPGLGEIEAHLTRDSNDQVQSVVLRGESLIQTLDCQKGPHYAKLQLPSKGFEKSEWVELEFYPAYFSVNCHTKNNVSFTTAKFQKTDKVLKSKEYSQNLRRHEEQHQFNNLFYPEKGVSAILNWQKGLNSLEARLTKHPEKSPKEVLSRYLAEKLREYFIDSSSRDEILAKLKGGSSLEQIKESMLTLSIYNFKNFEYTSGVTYIDMIARKVFTALSDLLRDGGTAIGLSPGEFIFLRTKLRQMVDLSNYNEVREEAEFVLGDLYKKKFFQWLDAVARLEKTGMDREGIVSYLGLLPVNSWKNAVRRKLMKEGNYEMPKTLKAHA